MRKISEKADGDFGRLSMAFLKTKDYFIPERQVLFEVISAAFFIIINGSVCVVEILKRREEETQSKLKITAMKWISVFVVFGGLLQSITVLLGYVNGLCYLFGPITDLDHNGSIIVIVYQGMFMALYQLCHLWYFIPKEVRHPRWLLIFVGSLGVFIAVMTTIWNFNYRIECGSTKGGDFSTTVVKWTSTFHTHWIGLTIYYAFLCSMLLYPLWELSTLLLFVFKLRSIMPSKTFSPSPNSKKDVKIMEIEHKMRRIILLTLFYLMMMFTIGFLIWVIFSDIGPRGLYDGDDGIVYAKAIGSLFISTVYSVSMWFMQPHNESEYATFLGILIAIKLHFCCFCYRHVVVEQQSYFDGKNLVISQYMDTTELTQTAFNDFSTDEVPSTLVQPRQSLIQLMPSQHHTLSIVEEDEIEDERSNEAKHKMPFNDFLYDKSHGAEQQQQPTNQFSFGVYLEYWRKNKKNYVKPRYSDFKKELTTNKHATITEEQYKKLTQDSEAKLNDEMAARNIGYSNKICNIRPGTVMTIQHMMAIKLYTDFDEIQRVFKRQCRRLYKGEPIEKVMARNSEIAHWCRLLAECILFYGGTMSSKMTLYSGMNAPLLFKSLLQHFECPLSTTVMFSVAQHFSNKDGSDGIVLKLKRGNPKTRYLNVSKFSIYKEENERLIKGSTLKIVDIFYKQKWQKHSVAALKMFEQIIRGMFIDYTVESSITLLSLMHRATVMTVVEQLPQGTIINLTVGEQLPQWNLLCDDAYDTDAVVADLENVKSSESESSNIAEMFGMDAFRIYDNLDSIRKDQLLHLFRWNSTKKSPEENLMDIESDDTAKYIWLLFTSILDEMKVMEQNGTLWINHEELGNEDKPKLKEIKDALFGDGNLLDHIGIKKDEIPSVQQYGWVIARQDYERAQNLGISEYVTSPDGPFVYTVDSDFVIPFHLRCYGKYTEGSQQCAIFVEVEEFPKRIKKLRIEADIKGILYKESEGMETKSKEYRQLLKTQILTRKKNICGFQLFDHKQLLKNASLKWVIGLKILRAEQFEYDEQEQYLEDLYQLF